MGHDEDFDSFGVLTQFIGPVKEQTNRVDALNQTSNELELLKKLYIEKTTTLDRATNHKEALQSSLAKGKTPNKLQINIKPLVVNREDLAFISKWNQITKQCETDLTNCLINHLDKVAEESRQQIRSVCNETYMEIKKKNDPTTAKAMVVEAIRQAEDTRETTRKTVQKRKLERAQNERQKS